jgi:type I restriction enzyme S subunit
MPFNKTPAICYAEFTGAWEQRKLLDISDKVTEKNANRAYTETLTNSAEFGIISQHDFFDKDISNEENIDGYYIVRNDDFVYNPRISTFAPVGPIKRNKLGRNGVMSPLYYVFRTHDIDPTYLEHFFTTTGWHRFMKLNGDSGARSDRFSIKDSVFREMPLPYPSLDEQKKIGAFFDAITDLITLHQREYDKTVNIKKAMLEKMFPKNGEDKPEIRFAGFTDAWEQRKLGEVVKMVGGATPSKANPAYWDGDIVWLSSQEIKDRYVSAGTYTITEKAMRESTTKVVPALTPLIVSRSGILARMFPITLPTVDVAINQDIKALFFEKNFLDTDFFVSQLESKEKTILSDTVKTGTTVQSVNMPDFEKLIITIPSMREQLQIGQLFKDLGNLITLHQRELVKLRNMKKALLEKMFV